MARSRSRSAFRDQPTTQSASAHKSVYNGSSPPRRRWTRSQSRELETGPGTNGRERQNKGGESRSMLMFKSLLSVLFCGIRRVYCFTRKLIIQCRTRSHRGISRKHPPKTQFESSRARIPRRCSQHVRNHDSSFRTRNRPRPRHDDRDPTLTRARSERRPEHSGPYLG